MYGHYDDYLFWESRTAALREDIRNSRLPKLPPQEEPPKPKERPSWLFMIEVSRWRLRIGLTKQEICTSLG